LTLIVTNYLATATLRSLICRDSVSRRYKRWKLWNTIRCKSQTG